VDTSCVFNQYCEQQNAEQFFSTRTNLKLYLSAMSELRPRVLMVGEAPGKKGCALSGIPFTSLDIASRKNKFGLFGFEGSTVRQKEASSTIVWEVLGERDVCPLLWNAYPFNPYKVENKKGASMTKNRKPSSSEIEDGSRYLKEIIHLFPSVEVIVAVGRMASTSLENLRITHRSIPHPSYGKKQAFRRGWSEIVSSLDRR